MPLLQPPCKNPASPGFTLVELLVVIVVIAVLCSLFLPVAGRIGEKSRSVKCRSSLRQIAGGLFSYASENNGEIPAAVAGTRPAPTDPFPSGNLRGNWYLDLAPYFTKEGINSTMVNDIYPKVNCPTFWNNPKLDKENADKGHIGFGMNCYLKADENNIPESTSGKRQKLVSLSKPSRTVIVGEASALNLDIAQSSWKFKKDTAFIEGWDNNGTPDRHGKHSNYLFLDGHIEALSQTAAEATLKPTNVVQSAPAG